MISFFFNDWNNWWPDWWFICCLIFLIDRLIFKIIECFYLIDWINFSIFFVVFSGKTGLFSTATVAMSAIWSFCRLAKILTRTSRWLFFCPVKQQHCNHSTRVFSAAWRAAGKVTSGTSMSAGSKTFATYPAMTSHNIWSIFSEPANFLICSCQDFCRPEFFLGRQKKFGRQCRRLAPSMHPHRHWDSHLRNAESRLHSKKYGIHRKKSPSSWAKWIVNELGCRRDNLRRTHTSQASFNLLH